MKTKNQYVCSVPTEVVDAGVVGQKEAVRQEKVKELDVRTQVALAAHGCKTVEEYTRAHCRCGYRNPNVMVRLKDGRLMEMGQENAVGAILRGAATLVLA